MSHLNAKLYFLEYENLQDTIRLYEIIVYGIERELGARDEQKKNNLLLHCVCTNLFDIFSFPLHVIPNLIKIDGLAVNQ